MTESFLLPGPKPGADYAITILTPDRPAPENGYPVVYALDGTAVVEALDPAFLATLDGPDAPVIVAVGYDAERRFASEERTRDYTPPSTQGGDITDPRGRAAGGAPAFHALLVDQVIPRAEALVPVDPARRSLWGHSYAGLFVLQSAMRPAPSPFSRFFAASPSLWWDDMRYLKDLRETLGQGAAPAARVDFHIGGAERQRASLPPGAEVKPFIRMRAALPPDALTQLVEQFFTAGNSGIFTIFPGLSHGESFARSLREALIVTSTRRDR